MIESGVFVLTKYILLSGRNEFGSALLLARKQICAAKHKADQT